MLKVELASMVTQGERHSGDLKVIVHTMKSEKMRWRAHGGRWEAETLRLLFVT